MSNAVGAYLHSRPNGTPFYVGKGTVKRSRDLCGASRSDWHQKITAKYGRENVIVNFMECSTEEFAFLLEKGMIKTLVRNGYALCNFTSGGEGVSGWKMPREIVERINAKNRGRVQSAEERAMRSSVLRGIKKSVPMSDEHKRKLGLNAKGKKWYNNGTNIVFCLEGQQPEGYVLGRKCRTLVKEY
jgi:hypothetical protein